jgi:hypothetical protein
MFSEAPDFTGWFAEQEGFPRPDWPAIGAWIKGNVPPERSEDAWQGITREWLDRTRTTLGGDYRVAEAQHFHLLSELDERAQHHLLSFLEEARSSMLRRLDAIHLPKGHGKHVVLRFGTEDDYYRYISYFDPEGEHAGSSGMFLRRGYLHVAYPHHERLNADQAVLVHEFSHNLLVNLPLPSWLSEALAMAFERDIAGSAGPPLTRELAEEHRAYWNAQTIQEFWRGLSFHKIESQKLAYSLARILLDFITTDLQPPPAQFRDFVIHADRKDAGQAAAQAYLEIDLADLVATFLGPGDWQPLAESFSNVSGKIIGGEIQENAYRDRMNTSLSLLFRRLLFAAVSLAGLCFVASHLSAVTIDDPICQTVLDAATKMEQVSYHQYMTITREGAKPIEAESIHIGDAAYVKARKAWQVSPLSPKDVAKQREENIRNSKIFTCRHDRDEEMNGEPASVYETHQENDDIKADAEIWISKKSGLIIKEIVTHPEEKQSITIRIDYANVQKPAGVN